MKVFLAGSPRGSNEFGVQYQSLYDAIKDLGYTHVDDDIIKVSDKEFSSRMNQGRKAYIDLYERKTTAIQNADICIFETSIHSLGVGFLVQRSLDYGKPTVVLYYKDYIPYFISGAESDKLVVRSYNEKNYKKVIKESLEIARERRDKRFNFFLSPKLLEYLEDASTKEGVTKSKLIRDMIVTHMRKHSTEPVGE